jgi:hypothetical protein
MSSLSHNRVPQPALGPGSVGPGAAARGSVVSRTHRIVRERAQALQERRSRTRSLLLPVLLSSVLLALSTLAVWTGLYQYQGVESVEADVSSLADANNHFMVVLLWFVPVSLAVLSALWMRHSRGQKDDLP